MIKIAVLDDYQNVALKMADSSVLADRAEITVFNEHIADTGALVETLLPFDVVCVMRERTPPLRDILGQLPQLKLIASTGSRNASIDVAAALIAALQSRAIAGVALDVFNIELLPATHPFRSLDNVIATPHIGYVAEDLYRTFYRDTVVKSYRGWTQRARASARWPTRLKADPMTREIPIIALSAYAMAGDREKALTTGCDDFDTKPVEFDRLLTKIEHALVLKGR
jgi:phosphoglycerate dehydrogenase-like enzyme